MLMPHSIEYSILPKTGAQGPVNFKLYVDSEGMRTNNDFIPPDWALLKHHQCAHCTLDANEFTYCPIAKNISFLFKDTSVGNSFDEVELIVRTENRSYLSDTTLQRALGSLFGLVCSLSSCPHTMPLRPLGFFHLPLSTEVETIFKTSAFFILKKYMDYLENKSVNIDLSEMTTTYQNLNLLNKYFINRLRNINSSDAIINGMILLDLLVKDIDFATDNDLSQLKPLFVSSRSGNENNF